MYRIGSLTQSLDVECDSPCLQSWNFNSTRWKMLSFACSHAFILLLISRLKCTHLLFLLHLYLTVSLVCAQAVRAEAGVMSTPTNPEVKELNPVDFIQLQQYIECEYRQAGRRAGSFLSA